jgi:DNA topoisomerase-1
MAKRHVRRRRRPAAFMEPPDAARAVNLQYVSDILPGIRRRRAGSGFSYTGPDGLPVRDRPTLKRIRALAIPPAWTDVWICPVPDGHLQATGRDAKGRKQYRYHRRWHAVRDETKYERMQLFASTLPRIREQVQQDLARPGLPREKVLAIIVGLLETTFIRVGNEEYARQNNSFGLTTLRTRHVKVEGGAVHFRFPGKSGKKHAVRISDRRLAQLVRRLRDLPGQELFQYLDDNGEPQPINSSDVNRYLRDIAGQEFTAKDFRTWYGTLLAARHLAGRPEITIGVPGRSAMLEATREVAVHLGNTPGICRKCYIHPAVLEAHQNEELYQLWLAECSRDGDRSELTAEEATLLRFLQAAQPLLLPAQH